MKTNLIAAESAANDDDDNNNDDDDDSSSNDVDVDLDVDVDVEYIYIYIYITPAYIQDHTPIIYFIIFDDCSQWPWWPGHVRFKTGLLMTL